MMYLFKLRRRRDPSKGSRVPPKNTFFSNFSRFSLSPHTRSRRGANRIRQGEGCWSRPSKTALERSDLTEKFQFREPHTEAETKKTPGQSLSYQKHESFYIEICFFYLLFCFRMYVYTSMWPGCTPERAVLFGQMGAVCFGFTSPTKRRGAPFHPRMPESPRPAQHPGICQKYK